MEVSLSCGRRQFRSGPPHVCLLLTTERHLLQESLYKVTLKVHEKNHPGVPFLVDGETLRVSACSPFESVDNLSLMMDVHSRPASDMCQLCDLGPHVHPFWPRVSPLLNEEHVAVLRASDALVLCVPSMELLEG